jgi:hypothetical protein
MTTTTTNFGTWKKVKAGHYVLATDTGYTATIYLHKGWGYRAKSWQWLSVVTDPSGEIFYAGIDKTMRGARYNTIRALNNDPLLSHTFYPTPRQIDYLPEALLAIVREG